MKVTKTNIFLSMAFGLGLLSACGSGTTTPSATTTTTTTAPAASATMADHIKEVEGLTAVDFPMNGGAGQKQYVKTDTKGGTVWLFQYADEGKTILSTTKTTFLFAEIDKDLLTSQTIQKSEPDAIFNYEIYSISLSGKNLKDVLVEEKYMSKDAEKKQKNVSVGGLNFRDEASANSFLQELKSGVAAAQ